MTAQFLSSGDMLADRRFEFARELELRGDLAAAADLMAQAVELAPSFASAWFALGELRDKLGDRAGAIDAFRKAREAQTDDRLGAGLHLARLGAAEATAMPETYVRTLFDQYAPRFDEALSKLDYRGPALLHASVEAACRAQGRQMRFGSALDLGCGTGLAGVVFRPHVDWLFGVDLSEPMVAEAKKKGAYDKLSAGDVMTFLAEHAEQRAQFHLVVAADVLPYIADLVPLMTAVACVLAPGGLFAFTTETHAGDGVMLGEKLRYAHGTAHVRAALDAAELKTISLDPCSTRTEAGVAVPGLIAVAQQSTQQEGGALPLTP